MESDLKEREEASFTPKGLSTDGEFKNIAKNNVALDDQGGAIARDHLNGVEQNPGHSNDIFGYLAEQSDKAKSQGKQSFFSRNKKGIAGGGAVVITIGGFFTMIAPMKLHGILDMVTGTGTVRIEGYIERRAQKAIARSIMQRFGVGDRNLVRGGSLIERIAKTMTASKYEERLAAKGLEFYKDTVGGRDVVKLRITNNDSREARAIAEKFFSDADDLAKALEETPLTRKMMKAIISEDMGVWRFFVRGNLTRWMLSYLGVPRLGTPKNNPKEAAIEDVIDTTRAQGRAIEQAFDLGGTVDKLGAEPPGDPDVHSKGSQAAKSLLDEESKIAQEAIEEATEATVRKVAAETTSSLGSRLIKNIGAKLAPKGATGWYALISMGASLTVLTHYVLKSLNDESVYRAIATPAGTLMGYTYARWAGISSQAKLDELDHSLYNYYVPYLDGVETSALFNCVDNNWQADCDKAGEEPYKRINEINNTQTAKTIETIASVADTITTFDPMSFGIPLSSDVSPTYLVARTITNLEDEIFGFLFDAAMGPIMDVLEVVWGELPQGVKDDITGSLTKLAETGMQFLLKLFGLEVSPMAEGNKLFDILLNGSVWTANRYAESSLGLHSISNATAQAQTEVFLAEKREAIKDKGMLYALFSPEVSSSFTSQLVSRTSYSDSFLGSLRSGFSVMAGLVRDTPQSLASIASGSVYASTYTTPEAVLNAIPMGMTNQELDSPLHESTLTGEACSGENSIITSAKQWYGITSDPKDFSTCLIDKAVAESILCSLDESITETAECNPDVGGGGGSGSSGGGGGGSLVDGDVKELALKVLNHPNITFNGPPEATGQDSKNDLLKISKGEAVHTVKGNPWVPKKLMFQAVLYIADRYKITINNFGGSDRDRDDGGYHSSGEAVDLNSATPINGGTTTSFQFPIGASSGEQDTVYGVAKDWMEAVKKAEPDAGGIGQKFCGDGNYMGVSGWFNISSRDIPGTHAIDSCNHLHLSLGRGGYI